jgi:alpha-beta hydrolase superfamily lysophospholipase
VAEALTAARYVVYAHDHRGHGQTAEGAGELGWFGPGGFDRVVEDLGQVIGDARSKYGGLPLFLLGHSMGSYIAQSYIIESGSALRGVVLSGSSGKPSLVASAGRWVARLERLRQGAKGKSKLLGDLSFGAFNKSFGKTRTEFDWLSRDAAEVDKYIADPLCGFMVSTDLWVEVLDAVARNADPARQQRVPRDLPVLIIAGSEDPVGERTKTLVQLAGAYRRAGVVDVTEKYYPGGRHEMLNETNRDEVTRDIIAWLDGHV